MEDILIDAAPDDFRRDRVPWVFIVILCIPREVFARSERIILRLPVIGAFFFAASLTHTSHLSLDPRRSQTVTDRAPLASICADLVQMHRTESHRTLTDCTQPLITTVLIQITVCVSLADHTDHNVPQSTGITRLTIFEV